MECMNYRFTVEHTFSQEVIVLHLYKLKCHYEDCEDQFCDKHGTGRALSEECHKELENANMFMPIIDHLAPINFLCPKCLSASGIEGEIIGRKSSLKHIKEDMRVNEIIICEEKMMERFALSLKSEAEVHVI